MFGQQRPSHTEYTGPRCIAGFCFDDAHPILESEFVAHYGKSRTVEGVYCYRVSEQDLFVRFDVFHGESKELEEVFVSKIPNCLRTFSETVRSKLAFKKFITAEGIGLGDSYSKVVATYGPPTHVERGTDLELRGLEHNKVLNSAPFGDKVLIYSGPDNDAAQFYFRNGRVSAILISVSE
jgi:hypothetical protein